MQSYWCKSKALDPIQYKIIFKFYDGHGKLKDTRKTWRAQKEHKTNETGPFKDLVDLQYALGGANDAQANFCSGLIC
uniref:Uncharacterized protein n=1 Tax=Romanomermis culicivorax TaxID=13658 RepID=A0A915KNP6_ROMCU